MPKSAHQALPDAYLNEIANNANLMCTCSQQPTTRDEALTTYSLGNVAVAPSDFALGPGDAGGRKLTVTEKSGVTATGAGTGNHVALIDDTRLLFVTEALISVSFPGTFTIPSWSQEVRDPE